MNSRSRRLAAVGVAVSVLGLVLLPGAPGAFAQEGTAPVQPSLRLNLLNPTIDPPERAFQDLLRSEAPPAPRSSAEWTILPDGSARYGTDTFAIIVSPRCWPNPALTGRVPR